jgi:hypothetical protein
MQGLTADGEYGEKSHKAMMEAIGDDEPDFEEDIPVIIVPEEGEVKEIRLQVTGNSVRVRAGDSTKYEIITTVRKGNILVPILGVNNKPLISKNNWYAIERSGQIGWISGNYIKVV